MQKNEHPGSVGALLIVALAFVGGTANVGYWLYQKHLADSLDSPIFEAAVGVRDSESACRRDRERLARVVSEEGQFAATADPVATVPGSCQAVAGAKTREDALLREQSEKRATAWQSVPVLVVWPILAMIGVIRHARAQRR